MKTSQEDVPYGLVSETTTDPKCNTVEKWYDSLDKIYKVIDGNDITVYNYYKTERWLLPSLYILLERQWD